MISINSFLFLIYKFSKKKRLIWRVLRKILLPILNLYLKTSDFLTFKFLRKNQINSTSKIIHIHSQVWGEYLDWFLKYNLPSLLQKNNLPKIATEGYEIHLYIYTSIQDKEKFQNPDSNKILDYFSTLGKVHFNYFDPKEFQERNEIQIKNLLHFINNCLKNNAYFIHSPPDVIFGNNSIYNGLKSIEGKNVCFSVPIGRVALSKITKLKEIKDLQKLTSCISNPKLVNYLFKSLHSEMQFNFDNVDTNTTFNTGVSIRKLSKFSYAVIHNTPSVKLGKFNFFDLIFFYFSHAFNDWDRRWSSLLLRSNRLKICGSSDMFFVVELTKDFFKDPIFNKNMLNNDRKNEGIKLEHLIPNQFISFWHGE